MSDTVERSVSLRGNVWHFSDIGNGSCWWYQQSQYVKVVADSVNLSAALDRIHADDVEVKELRLQLASVQSALRAYVEWGAGDTL